MSKGKINQEINTKISKFVAQKQQNIETEKHGFTVQKKDKTITKSFRLNAMDLKMLSNLVFKINESSPYRNYSEGHIIRGLIHLATNLDTKHILKTLQTQS